MIYYMILSYYAPKSPHRCAVEINVGERSKYWKAYRFHPLKFVTARSTQNLRYNRIVVTF